MTRKATLELRCPICKKTVRQGDAEFPFCSPRCRTIDLGKWASGAYVIQSPVTDAEELLQDEVSENRHRGQNGDLDHGNPDEEL